MARRRDIYSVAQIANVSEPYEALQFALADLQLGAADATSVHTAVESFMAGTVSTVARQQYDAYIDRVGGPTLEGYRQTPEAEQALRESYKDPKVSKKFETFEGYRHSPAGQRALHRQYDAVVTAAGAETFDAYFKRADSWEQLRAQPTRWGDMADLPVKIDPNETYRDDKGKIQKKPWRVSTLGREMPEAVKPKNIGETIDFLGRAVIPGVLKQAGQADKKYRTGLTDAMMEPYRRSLEDVIRYNPEHAEFQTYFQKRYKTYAHNVRGESKADMLRSSSLSSFESDDTGGDGEDTGTNSVLDTGGQRNLGRGSETPEAAGGMADTGLFEERPVAPHTVSPKTGQRRLDKRATFTELQGRSEVNWGNYAVYDVAKGAFTEGGNVQDPRDAVSWKMVNVPEPLRKQGVQEGSYFLGIGDILKREDADISQTLYDLADQAESGGKVDVWFGREKKGGGLAKRVQKVTTTGSPMRLDSGEVEAEKPSRGDWLRELGEMVDPNYGRTVVSPSPAMVAGPNVPEGLERHGAGPGRIRGPLQAVDRSVPVGPQAQDVVNPQTAEVTQFTPGQAHKDGGDQSLGLVSGKTLGAWEQAGAGQYTEEFAQRQALHQPRRSGVGTVMGPGSILADQGAVMLSEPYKPERDFVGAWARSPEVAEMGGLVRAGNTYKLGDVSDKPSNEYKYQVVTDAGLINEYRKIYEEHPEWSEYNKQRKNLQKNATRTAKDQVEEAYESGRSKQRWDTMTPAERNPLIQAEFRRQYAFGSNLPQDVPENQLSMVNAYQELKSGGLEPRQAFEKVRSQFGSTPGYRQLAQTYKNASAQQRWFENANPEAYQQWRSGAALEKAYHGLKHELEPVSTGSDSPNSWNEPERTIEQADQEMSAADRYLTPGEQAALTRNTPRYDPRIIEAGKEVAPGNSYSPIEFAPGGQGSTMPVVGGEQSADDSVGVAMQRSDRMVPVRAIEYGPNGAPVDDPERPTGMPENPVVAYQQRALKRARSRMYQSEAFKDGMGTPVGPDRGAILDAEYTQASGISPVRIPEENDEWVMRIPAPDGQAMEYIRRPEVRQMTLPGRNGQPGKVISDPRSNEWLIPQGQDLPEKGMPYAAVGGERVGAQVGEDEMLRIAGEELKKLSPSRLVTSGGNAWQRAMAQAAVKQDIPVTLSAAYAGVLDQGTQDEQAAFARLRRDVVKAGGEVVVQSRERPKSAEEAKALHRANDEAIVGQARGLVTAWDGGQTFAWSSFREGARKKFPILNTWGSFTGSSTRTRQLSLEEPKPRRLVSRRRYGLSSVESINRKNSDKTIQARMRADGTKDIDAGDVKSERALEANLTSMPAANLDRDYRVATETNNELTGTTLSARIGEEASKNSPQSIRALTSDREQREAEGTMRAIKGYTTGYGQMEKESQKLLREMQEGGFTEGAVRATMVGHDPQAFSQTVRRVAKEYKADISYKPGQEEAFAEQFSKLEESNPEAAKALSAEFPQFYERVRNVQEEYTAFQHTPASLRKERAATYQRLQDLRKTYEGYAQRFTSSPVKDLEETARQSVTNVAKGMLSDVRSAGSTFNKETHQASREGGAEWYWNMYDAASKGERKNLHRNVEKQLGAIIAGTEKPENALAQTLKADIFGQLTGQVPTTGGGYGVDQAFAKSYIRPGDWNAMPPVKRSAAAERQEAFEAKAEAMIAKDPSLAAPARVEEPEPAAASSERYVPTSNGQPLPRATGLEKPAQASAAMEPPWEEDSGYAQTLAGAAEPQGYGEMPEEDDYIPASGELPQDESIGQEMYATLNDAEEAEAWKAYNQTGDRQSAREMLLHPQGKELPAQRSLPRVTAQAIDKVKGLFTDKDVEEAGMLVARRDKEGRVEVFDAIKPRQEKGASGRHVRISPAMDRQAAAYAKAKGGFIAGSIHTHPRGETVEDENLRPSRTDVLGLNRQGTGGLSPKRWLEDTVHMITNPKTGSFGLWNIDEEAAYDVTQTAQESSGAGSRVGPRYAGAGSAVLGSVDEPPTISEEEWAQIMGENPSLEDMPDGPATPQAQRQAQGSTTPSSAPTTPQPKRGGVKKPVSPSGAKRHAPGKAPVERSLPEKPAETPAPQPEPSVEQAPQTATPPAAREAPVASGEGTARERLVSDYGMDPAQVAAMSDADAQDMLQENLVYKRPKRQAQQSSASAPASTQSEQARATGSTNRGSYDSGVRPPPSMAVNVSGSGGGRKPPKPPVTAPPLEPPSEEPPSEEPSAEPPPEPPTPEIGLSQPTSTATPARANEELTPAQKLTNARYKLAYLAGDREKAGRLTDPRLRKAALNSIDYRERNYLRKLDPATRESLRNNPSGAGTPAPQRPTTQEAAQKKLESIRKEREEYNRIYPQMAAQNKDYEQTHQTMMGSLDALERQTYEELSDEDLASFISTDEFENLRSTKEPKSLAAKVWMDRVAARQEGRGEGLDAVSTRTPKARPNMRMRGVTMTTVENAQAFEQAAANPAAGMRARTTFADYDFQTGKQVQTWTADRYAREENGQVRWFEDTPHGEREVTAPAHGQIIDAEGTVVAEYSESEHRQMQRARKNDAVLNRQMTTRELAFGAARNVSVDAISTMHNEYVGEASRLNDGSWQMVKEDKDSGLLQVNAEHGQIQRAYDVAQAAVSESFNSGPLPADPKMAVATLRERMQQAVTKGVEADVERDIKAGTAPDIARAKGKLVKDMADHYLKAIGGQVEKAVSDDLGVDLKEARLTEREAVRLKGFGEAAGLVERSENVRKLMGDRSLESIRKSGEAFMVEDEQGKLFDLGSGGQWDRDAPGKGRGRGGLWGGAPIGSLMYGAYMLSREWKMAVGASLQQAEKYGDFMSSMGQVALSDTSMAAATDAGFTARREIGERYLGKTAYQQFGAFMDLPYLLSGYGEAPGRIMAGGKLAAGIAGGAYIGGSMLSMAGLMSAGTAASLGTAGLAVGGLMLAGTLGMEAYNAWGKPEGAEDITWSSIVRNTEKDLVRTRVTQAMYERDDASLTPKERRQRQAERQQMAYSAKWKANPENRKLTDQELIDSGLATEQEISLLKYEGTPKEVEELLEGATRIQMMTGEDQASTQQAAAMQKRMLGKIDMGMLEKFSMTAIRSGMAVSSLETEAGQYASQLGYTQGTEEYAKVFEQYGSEKDIAKREAMQWRAGRIAGLGSQLQAMMPTDERLMGLGARMVDRLNLNQSQVGAIAGLGSQLSQLGVQFNTEQEFNTLARLGTANTPFVTGVIGQAMTAGAMGGLSGQQALQFGTALSGAGLSNQQAFLYEKMLGGDMKAMSYSAWQNGTYANRMFDQSGNLAWETSGANAMNWLQANQKNLAQLPQASKFAGLVGGAALAGAVTGTDNAEIINAFLQSGTRGIEKLSRESQYESQRKSNDLQLRGIALQENFLWGQEAGGAWNAPTEGSSWGIENRQIALQEQSTRAGFAEQAQRMELSNQFGVRREANQWNRMQVSNIFQDYQWSQQYKQFQQQQVWTQQDWGYQDTMRGLQNAWGMEDINENIRFASGRQRRQLVRQRDRMALTQNLEGEQIDKQRDRQKELWSQEEERMQKQKEYTLELRALDEESFNINKEQREIFFQLDKDTLARRMSEYEQEKKLQDELRELQRKYQFDQIQLSKEGAALTAEAAEKQRQYSEALLQTNQNLGDARGMLEMMNQYNNAFRVANATRELMGAMDGVNTYRIQKIVELLDKISNTNTSSSSSSTNRLDERWGGEVD